MELNKERRMWPIIDAETGSLMFKVISSSCHYSSSMWVGVGQYCVLYLDGMLLLICVTVKSSGERIFVCLASHSTISMSNKPHVPLMVVMFV